MATFFRDNEFPPDHQLTNHDHHSSFHHVSQTYLANSNLKLPKRIPDFAHLTSLCGVSCRIKIDESYFWISISRRLMLICSENWSNWSFPDSFQHLIFGPNRWTLNLGPLTTSLHFQSFARFIIFITTWPVPQNQHLSSSKQENLTITIYFAWHTWLDNLICHCVISKKDSNNLFHFLL